MGNISMSLKQKFIVQYKSFKRSKFLLLIMAPGILYYVIFRYVPMYGVIIAFKDFSIYDGIFGSPWASDYGFGHFIELFRQPVFYRILKNTVLLSVYSLLFSFPAPIILALCLNEVKNRLWRSSVQTVSYLPHFISTVVICGMITNFLSMNGIVNQLMSFLGFEKKQFLLYPEYFRTIFVISEIWQKTGWNSILYMAALSQINPELYEACKIDGANRFQKIIYINIPGIIPTALILFILSVGGLMNVGFEKVLLLYNPNIYDTADVIGTYVYRRGILGAEFSFTTAVGLFQSVIGFILVVLANTAARKVNDVSLW
jgi:putative aldouronate transport system permease protein